MADNAYESNKSTLKTNVSAALAKEASDGSGGYESAAYGAYSAARDAIRDLAKIYRRADAELTKDADAMIQLIHYSLYQGSAMESLEGFSELSKLMSRMFGGDSAFDEFVAALKSLYAYYQKETDDAQRKIIRQRILELIGRYRDLIKGLLSGMDVLPSDAEASFNPETEEIEVKSDAAMAFESKTGKRYMAWKGTLDKSGWIAQSSTIYATAEYADSATETNPIDISVPLIGWNKKTYEYAEDHWLWNFLWMHLFNKTDYAYAYTVENDGSDQSNTGSTMTAKSSFRIGTVLSGHDSIYDINSGSGKKRVYFRTSDGADWSVGYMTNLKCADGCGTFTDKSVQIQCVFDDGCPAAAAIARKENGTLFGEEEPPFKRIEVSHIMRFAGDDADTSISGTLEYDSDLTSEKRNEAAENAKELPAAFKQLIYMIANGRAVYVIPYTTKEDESSDPVKCIGLTADPVPCSSVTGITASIDDSTTTVAVTAESATKSIKLDDETMRSYASMLSAAFGGASDLYDMLTSAYPDSKGIICVKKLDSAEDATDDLNIISLFEKQLGDSLSGLYFTGTISIDEDDGESSSDEDEAEASSSGDEYSIEAAEAAATDNDITSAIASVGASGASTAKVILCIKPAASGNGSKADIECYYDSDADVNKTDYGRGSDGLIDQEDKMLFGGEFSVADADITSSVILDSDEENLAACMLALDLLDPGKDDFDALLTRIMGMIEELRSRLLSMLKAYLTKISGAISSVTTAKTIYGSSDPNFDSDCLSDLMSLYSTASSAVSSYLATDGFDLEDAYDGTVYNALNEDLTAINDEYASLFYDAKSAISKLISTKGALFPISDAEYGNADFTTTATLMHAILKGTDASYATAASSNAALLTYRGVAPFASWHDYLMRVAGQINRYGRSAKSVAKDVADGKSDSFESLETYEYLDVPSAQEALMYALSRAILLADDHCPIKDAMKGYLREIAFGMIVRNRTNDKLMVTVDPDLAKAIAEYSNEVGDPSGIRDPNGMPINPALNILYPGASAFNEYDISPAVMKNDDSVKGMLAAKALAYKLIMANGADAAESDFGELIDITGLNGLNMRDYYLMYALLSAYKELADNGLMNAEGASSAITGMRKKLKASKALADFAFDDASDANALFTDQITDASAYLTAANKLIDSDLAADSDYESIRYRLRLLGFDSLASLTKLLDAKVIVSASKETLRMTATPTAALSNTASTRNSIAKPATRANLRSAAAKAATSKSSAAKCVMSPISTSSIQTKSSTAVKSVAASRLSLTGTHGTGKTLLTPASSSQIGSSALLHASVNDMKAELVRVGVSTTSVEYTSLDDLLTDAADIPYTETSAVKAWAAFSHLTEKTNVDKIVKVDGADYAFAKITETEFIEYMTAIVDEYAKLKNYIDDDGRSGKLSMRTLFTDRYPKLLAECEEIEAKDLAELESLSES